MIMSLFWRETQVCEAGEVSLWECISRALEGGSWEEGMDLRDGFSGGR